MHDLSIPSPPGAKGGLSESVPQPFQIGKRATVSNNIVTEDVDQITLLVELIAEAKNGYMIRVPSLPGCAAQGESESEAIETLKDVFRALMVTYGGIEGVRFEENPILNPNASRRYVSVELGRKTATSA